MGLKLLKEKRWRLLVQVITLLQKSIVWFGSLAHEHWHEAVSVSLSEQVAQLTSINNHT